MWVKLLSSKDLCCFVVMHLLFNSLSAIATISSLIILEFFPACFSCSNNFYPSQSSLRLDDKNFVFDSLRKPAIVASDLSSFIKDLSKFFHYLGLFHRNTFLLQNHKFTFYPAKKQYPHLVFISHQFQKISL